MNITNFARAALVAGAVTGASVGLAGHACAATLEHPATSGSSIVAPTAFSPAPVTALGSWRGKKDDDGGDDGGGDFGGGDFGGGDDGGDYSQAADDSGSDYDAGPDYSDATDDPAPQDDAPDFDPAPETPDFDPAPEAPNFDPAPEAPETDAAPEAPEFTPEPETAPEAPESEPEQGSDPAPEGPIAPEDPTVDPQPTDPQPTGTPDPSGPVSQPAGADVTQATSQEISELSSSIFGSSSVSSTTSSSWASQVTGWNSSWLSYDLYSRPVLFNSYATPMQIVYTYGGTPWTVTIPPRQNVVLPVTTPGQYGFTAVTRTPSGGVATVSVGNFTGGGGGQTAPAPGGSAPHAPTAPATPQTLHNVWVQLKYSTGVSQPFRVGSLTDLGDDATVGGRKVLIDGKVSAWGEWSKNADGSQQFEVVKTDQLPGVTAPAEAPLPGYDVALVANESTTKSGVAKVLPWVALAAGALGLGSVGGALLIGRRRRATGSR